MTKAELYNIVKRNKPPVQYVTNYLAEKYGHMVLRTPVRHCELNPIELIWGKVKSYVANNNTSFRIKDVEKLVNTALDNVTRADWESRTRHVISIEERMRTLDGIVDVQPVVIALSDTEQDSDSNSDTDVDD